MFRFLVLLCVWTAVFLDAAPKPQPFHRPLVFEPNRGQAPPHVKWIAQADGYRLLLTSEGATIMLADPTEEAPRAASLPRLLQPAQLSASSSKPVYSAVQMKLTGGRPWSGIEGLEPTGGISNYLFGSDPRQWHTNIPHYSKLSASQVYDGIDLVFYSHGDDLEYDFLVAPGADPKQIRLAFDGVEQMRVDRKSGDLLLSTTSGSEIRHMRPKVYQQVGNARVEVAAGYEVLDRRQATFTLAAYDRQRPLVIDPLVRRFATVLSANSGDSANSLAIDSSGNAYVTGSTDSTNFPRVNALQGDRFGTDAFVTKLSSSGSIVFSTYLGGNRADEGWGIAIDTTGVYVTGSSDSTDFPIKNSIYPNRSVDAFVTKLSTAGNSLIYSTYLGGSQPDYGSGIAVDSTHAAWTVGTTRSEDFPIAGGPSAGQQRKFGGKADAFLARIAPDGLSVAFSTFVGGPGFDGGSAVAIDRTGSVYATGSGQTGFPITTGMKPCEILTDNAFVVRLKGRGTQPRYATCLGSGNGTSIAVDASFNAYVTGFTYSGNFPTTPGAFQPTKLTPNVGSASGFVTKLGSLGTVVYSTYLGGKDRETYAYDIAMDASGAAYVVGETSSTDFPGLPVQPNPIGGFLSSLTPMGNGLRYSATFGAGIYGVSLFQPALTRPPRIYVAGYTGPGDAFVVKWE